MATNKETKLSLKEKLYQETLDEIAQKIQSGEINNKPRYWLNWGELTTVRRNMSVGELKYFTNSDIEKAVKLAIQKTYNALQAGKLTEAGQSLYDRRKDIEAHTAKKIFAELDNLHIVENWSNQKGKGIPLLLKQIDTYDAVKKKYKVD